MTADWILATLLVAGTAAAQPSICESLEEPPEISPLDMNVHYGSLYDWAGGHENAPLGIGRLALDGREDMWDWWHRVALPLYESPDTVPWGWYHDGWLVDGEAEPIASGTAAMVETEYERVSFIVLERRGDWLRFRYAKPTTTRDGIAWTPSCQLSSQGLRFEPWESRFTSGMISPLHFRSPEPHALRAEPDAGAARIRWIRGRHHLEPLEPLELDGDWMRVRVTVPSDYCASDEMKVERIDGWIRWRSPDKGPWVWYFTRGC